MKGVKITKDITKGFIAAFKGLGKKQVLIGIPENEDGRPGEKIGNAALGRIHETGSPIRNIPARPFLVPGAAEAAEKSIGIFKQGAIDSLTKLDPNGMDKTLNRVGLNAQSTVKKRIVNQVGFEPLKKGTIAARKRDGKKGEKALIRTGELLNSIKYVVRDKK